MIDGLNIAHKVRVVTLDGHPWFVAADVCRVLGLFLGKGAVRHLAKLGEDERRLTPLSGGGVRGGAAWLISEPGLYKLIMRSDKPVARPFQDWVTREVLPAIRKTGEFKMQPGEAMPLPSSFTDALRQHASTLIRLAEEQEAHAKTKAQGMSILEPATSAIGDALRAL